jgi:thiamine biosynthesis lipoprotein
MKVNLLRVFVSSWLALAACSACARPSGDARPAILVERARVSMGSELRVSVYAADERGGTAAIDEVFAEFERLESLMSVWRDGSDIQRLNAAAGERAVSVSPDVIAVLQAARQISEWTGGKFDVTFGALSDLWRFDHDQNDTLPDMSEVRRRLPLIDYRSLEIDDRAGTAFLRRRGMRAHLGGIGKGYAIDRAIAILRRRGLNDFLIQTGGDMYAAGQKDGRPWRLGIQDPRGSSGRVFATLDVSDETFSTSGDYERFFFANGRRYHHIIDPSTGEPAIGCRSVTIVARRATLADGLSTGVFLLGPDAGLALLARVPDVDAVIVTSTNQVLTTPRLAQRLALAAAPTDAP